MKKEEWNKLLIIAIFAVAMGFLEAAVVIYLRKIFYPAGFSFPLVGFISPEILNIEWIREFATIVMLASVAFLAGKKLYGRMAYFLFAFAVWDIFYYVFLKLTLGWPSSLLTWDLLFLIPLPWAGPVLSPLLCTALMIVTAFMLLNRRTLFNWKEWAFILIGSAVILYTWLIDYGRIILLGKNEIQNYIPIYFNWPVFLAGFAIIIAGIILFFFRTKKLSG